MSIKFDKRKPAAIKMAGALPRTAKPETIKLGEQGRATEARQAHDLKVAGSTPAPATSSEA